MIMNFIRSFFTRNGLYRHEYEVIASITKYVDDDLCIQLNAQLNILQTLASCRRFFDMKEVYFTYKVEEIPKSVIFKHKATAEFCRINFINSQQEIMKADISISDGLIDKIMFNKNPKKFFENISSFNTNVNVLNVNLWFNPNNYPSFDAVNESKLYYGWIYSIVLKNIASEVLPPIAAEERNMIIKSIDAKLPDDYIELIKQSDYVMLDKDILSCDILGLKTKHNIIHVQFPNYGYYLLANIGISDGGLGNLAVRDGEHGKANIVLLPYDCADQEIDLNTCSLVVAINNSLQMLYEEYSIDDVNRIFL